MAASRRFVSSQSQQVERRTAKFFNSGSKLCSWWPLSAVYAHTLRSHGYHGASRLLFRWCADQSSPQLHSCHLHTGKRNCVQHQSCTPSFAGRHQLKDTIGTVLGREAGLHTELLGDLTLRCPRVQNALYDLSSSVQARFCAACLA